MPRPRALGYARVSTQEQTSGFGLALQERAIREWATRESVRVVDIVGDEGQSGANGIESRPGLAQVLARLEAGEAGILVVYRMDRLARDLVLAETTIERLRARGRSVVSVTEPDLDSDDPTRVLVRQVLGALSQYERALIRARMMAGREAKRAAGGYAGGRPPYGQRATGGELRSDGAEQEVIRLARRLRRQGRSLRGIGKELQERGHLPRSGDRWHPTQVGRLLQSARE